MRKKLQHEIVTDTVSLEAEARKQLARTYDFEDVVNSAKGLDEKKRLLWKQIYKNAVDDRASAGILFTNAFSSMGQTSTDHMAMGTTLVKYLEKMSKANQQLLDLSSIISRDDEQNSQVDPDDIFRQIEGKDE